MSYLLDEEKVWTQRDFGLDSRLIKALSKLGFIYPTLVQSKCIPIALEGKDALVRARTGSGKTLAFGLPVLHKILVQKSNSKLDKSYVRALILAPTKELCKQIEKNINDILYYCKDTISICSLADDSTSAQQYRLKNKPDIVVSTPAKIVSNIRSNNIDLSNVQTLVIDEADLVLSFGYAEDVQFITSKMPKIFQGLLMSATLSPDLDKFKAVLLHNAVILKLEEELNTGLLHQFYLKSSESDKFLILYVFLKLGLLQGKGLIFANDVNKCYRIKLFLQQFYISAAVLNSEVPLNSRVHIIEEYNRGVFDYLIATDACIDNGEENEVWDEESEEDDEENNDDEDEDEENNDEDEDGDNDDEDEEEDNEEQNEEEDGNPGLEDDNFDYGDSDDDDDDDDDDIEEINHEDVKINQNKKISHKKKGKETNEINSDYGVSRGIDFQGVTFVINFDLPKTAAAYTHRIGRTARGGASGTALSFVTTAPPANSVAVTRNSLKSKELEIAIRDHQILRQVQKQQPRLGSTSNDTNQQNPLKSVGNYMEATNNNVDSNRLAYEEDESKLQPAPLVFNFKELDNFRYRVEDTLRSVTRAAVKEFRTAEIKREILNSTKLKSYFAENPNDLKVLRHDKSILHPIVQKEHLKHIPDYLIPSSMRGMSNNGNGGRKKTKKRKISQNNMPLDKKIMKSKNKDPLLNLTAANSDTTEIKPAEKPIDNLGSWKESQNHRTSGRFKWKMRHRKGDFNPKKKASL